MTGSDAQRKAHNQLPRMLRTVSIIQGLMRFLFHTSFPICQRLHIQLKTLQTKDRTGPWKNILIKRNPMSQFIPVTKNNKKKNLCYFLKINVLDCYGVNTPGLPLKGLKDSADPVQGGVVCIWEDYHKHLSNKTSLASRL